MAGGFKVQGLEYGRLDGAATRQELDDQHDERDHKQQVNQRTTNFTDKAEQPQDDNYQ